MQDHPWENQRDFNVHQETIEEKVSIIQTSMPEITYIKLVRSFPSQTPNTRAPQPEIVEDHRVM